jgi:glycosyltransferase involved in cell wall biosynthesis
MSAQPVLVSVIIPAYYSHSTLDQCLEGLRQQYVRDAEVVVVNSSPEAETARVVDRYPEVRFIQHPHRLLPHAARNQGVRQARGEWLAFTDPDCRPHPQWLEFLLDAQRNGRDPVGGSLGYAGAGWVQRGIHFSKFSPVLPGHRAGPRWILPTANLCCSRQLWERVGPFRDDVFSGDALFSWQARAAGFLPWCEPRARVDHLDSSGRQGPWRERFERGRDFARVRMEFERWSRAGAARGAATWPLGALWALGRSAIDAWRARCFGAYLRTLPAQAMSHLAWCGGEGREMGRTAFGRNGRRGPGVPA